MLAQNVFTEARLRFESQQKELHGCNYENGVCLTHNGKPPAPSKPKVKPKKGSK